MKIDNKVAIVTGAAMGIGLGIAEALAKEKYNIVVTDIKLDQCKKAAQTIKKMGVETLAVKCDVSKKSEVDKLFVQTIKKFGRVDVLVNNAGVYPFVPFAKMTEANWTKVMDVNLKGVFLCSSQAAKNMKNGGRIINISSIASLVGFEGLTHYCASKGAVNGFTRALALELAPKNILVNAVAPGAIKTPGATGGVDSKVQQQMIAGVPLARWGEPKDIAGAVVFLASDNSSYLTGQVIVVDGGWTLR